MPDTYTSFPSATQASHAASWRSFVAAPHRMFFFGGVWALMLSLLWWTAVLLPLPVVLPAPRWIHGWLMVFGAVPFFVFGFLFTAMPRWLGMPAFAPRFYRSMGCALMAGYVLALVGAVTARPVALVGMLVSVVALLLCLLALAHLYWRSRNYSNIHAGWAVAAIAAGVLGAIGATVAGLFGQVGLLYAAPRFAAWAFLASIVFTVAHRMLPFFANAVLKPHYTMYRPRWAPAVVIPLFWLHAILLLTDYAAWVVLPDLPLLAITSWLLWRWQPWKTWREPLLWSLFVAFAWLPVALALSAWQSFAMLALGGSALGLAPLHALAIGLVASMIFAMATRVSMGHSGRALKMERFAVACFVLLQAAAITRICAMFDLPFGTREGWLTTAGVLWLIAFTPWALRMSYLYWHPRADGRPG